MARKGAQGRTPHPLAHADIQRAGTAVLLWLGFFSLYTRLTAGAAPLQSGAPAVNANPPAPGSYFGRSSLPTASRYVGRALLVRDRVSGWNPCNLGMV